MDRVTLLLKRWNIEYCESSPHIFVIDNLMYCTVIFYLSDYKNFNEFIDDVLELDNSADWQHISSNARGLILDYNNIHWSFIFRKSGEKW